MQITPSVLAAIFYSFDTIYQKAYETAEPWSQKVATQVPSGGRSLRHAWINKLPRMRQWLGERQNNNLVANGFEIVNQDYELSVAIDRNDIEDDQIGVYNPVVEMVGIQAKKWPDDLITTLLQNGATSLGFDGVSFFNASHPMKMADGTTTNYSNYYSSGKALTSANFDDVRAKMRAIKGEDGKPMGILPNLLVVPPALETTARQILFATTTAPAVATGQNAASAQQTNVLTGLADLLVVPELAGNDTTWFLLDVSKPIRPFVFQLRKAPVMVSRFDPSMDNVYRFKEFQFGVDSRGAAGYSLPFLAACAVG